MRRSSPSVKFMLNSTPRSRDAPRRSRRIETVRFVTVQPTAFTARVEASRHLTRCAREDHDDRMRPVDGEPIDHALLGELVTETFDYDGGRAATVYVPPDRPRAVVFAGDGELTSRWGDVLEAADVSSTMIVGVHRVADETLRLHEYSPRFDPGRFAAHERFFVHDIREWTKLRFGVALPVERTAVCGVSAGGELALALGLRHPDTYGTVFCASPGAGYQPPTELPSRLPRAYLVAGTLEPFFLDNATRWAAALRDAGADVVMRARVGSHGDPFWRDEFPLMVAWAFGP
jgi:enterochelin esterase-like enzyme